MYTHQFIYFVETEHPALRRFANIWERGGKQEKLTTKLFFIPPLMVHGTQATLVLMPSVWKYSER